MMTSVVFGAALPHMTWLTPAECEPPEGNCPHDRSLRMFTTGRLKGKNIRAPLALT